MVTSQIRPNLPFIDSPGTSCSSASQKLATIPEDSPNSASKEEETIRVKVEENEEEETEFIHYSSGRNCCLTRKAPCDKDLLKSWHNVHFYLLYLIMVLNVFITAFGLSGENLRLQSEQKWLEIQKFIFFSSKRLDYSWWGLRSPLNCSHSDVNFDQGHGPISHPSLALVVNFFLVYPSSLWFLSYEREKSS